MASLTSLAPLVVIFSFVLFILYRAFLGPLRSVPGPLLCKITSLWSYYHSYIGDECTKIDNLHKQYGPVIRIGPNEVSISDGAALFPIYSEKGGFLKAPCYGNFDFEGHSTIFSAIDPAHRAVRSKAVVPAFSMSNIRAGQGAIEGVVKGMINRLKFEKSTSIETGRPVNILNLTRSLALDAASSYLFGRSFGGIEEGAANLSANSYVDAVVAVGRLFFIPPWIFHTIEAIRSKYLADNDEQNGFAKVDDYASSVVNEVDKDDNTYQGRLLKAGISKHEAKVQVADVVFAATDSTGTNIATIIWNLAKHPETHQRLRDEVRKADAEDPTYQPQSLYYLDAVVKEGLRLAMANPVRFPRVVPPQGLSFEASDGKTFFLPSGTQVGVQPFTLHLNPRVFPEPLEFRPERWLDLTPEMQRDWIPFGMGARQCIARNLATTELLLATRAIVRENVLEGAETVVDKLEYLEWFNSKIIGERIELVWRA